MRFFIITLLSCLVLRVWSIALGPYGCTECQQKGGVYCVQSAGYATCEPNLAACVSPGLAIANGASCAGYSSCADLNYDCTKCIANSTCQVCASTDVFCIPNSGLGDSCFQGVEITSASQCTTAASILCTAHDTCSQCLAASGCYWCPPSNESPNPPGCSSTQCIASASCSSPTSVCPLRSSNYQNRCNCTTDANCAVCYTYGDIYNYQCTSVATPICQSQFSSCNDLAVVCPAQINPFDPYGTRCACTSFTGCSLCITQPPNTYTAPAITCVDAASPPTDLCASVVASCQDPQILCPTQLSCSDCTAESGCTWCETNDVTWSSSCIATASASCPSSSQATTTCSTCDANSDCTSCLAASGCEWCYDSAKGKGACMQFCSATNNTALSSCATADPCNAYTSCSTCIGSTSPKCTFCQGIVTSTGHTPGAYCTSLATCGNPQGCGYSSPCSASVFTSCTGTAQCSTYTDCLSCKNQPNPTYTCNWCEDGSGARSCDVACSPGSAVPTCAVFGPTTTGLTVPTGDGQTSSKSTGSAGNTPTSTGVTSGSPSPSGGTSGGSTTGSQTSGSPSPSSGQTSGSPSPSSGQTSGSPSPSSGQTSGSPSPSSGQTSGSPSPSSGQTSGSPSPSSGQTSGSPSPSSGQTSGSPSPSSGQTSGSPSPSSGQTSGSPSPSSGQTSGSPSPSSGQTSGSGGIMGNGEGVVNGFDWILFAIIVGVLLFVIIVIVVIVVVVKHAKAEEQV